MQKRSCALALTIMWSVTVLASLLSLGQQLDDLMILRAGYPRAFFFRFAEGFAANPRIEFERWDRCFSRLMGIEGKVLDEEVPGRSVRNIEFFTRFKDLHPQQLVLLHFNGNARDPRWKCQEFFAGHFLYYNGSVILSDVPAEEGTTEIKVADPSLFRTGIGRYRRDNDDIGLCELDENGRPDWGRSEQVQLVSVDPKRKVIVVRRGCYGTKPRQFRAGRAYAAAHVTEGPWGRKSHLLWYYNYATTCPRDADGRNCSDILAAQLAELFSAEGSLAKFDGLEFDVLHYTLPRAPGRAPDCDADGKPDAGWIDGRNVYGIGVVEFCRKLRKLLGSSRLILADGGFVANQRAFQILNGIESEGFPTLRDWLMEDWSGGLNRHFFWRENAFPPAFSYINHKYVVPGEEPGQVARPEVPWNIHRLVFAAAVFTDSAICYSFPPPARRGELVGIWDELCMGTENRIGWLGKPLGPAVRLARDSRDLLADYTTPFAESLKSAIQGNNAVVEVMDDTLIARPKSNSSNTAMSITVDVPALLGSSAVDSVLGQADRSGDFTIELVAETDPIEGYPAEIARRLWVTLKGTSDFLLGEDLPEVGFALRGGMEQAVQHGGRGAILTAVGALLRWVPQQSLNGKSYPAYLVHPPFKSGQGYTYWMRRLTLPSSAQLRFYTGLSEKGQQRGDGVIMSVQLAEVEQGAAHAFREVFRHHQTRAQWEPHTVDLSRWSGKSVVLKFVTDCGPADDTVADHAFWGQVVVVPGDQPSSKIVSTKRIMTWVNRRPFRSFFYFSDFHEQLPRIKITLDEPGVLRIKELHLYPAPDVIYREFEQGLVLANPSPHEVTIDLRKYFPGSRWRRLKGSPDQDPQTNNGRPVDGLLTLRAKDALFLVRVD